MNTYPSLNESKDNSNSQISIILCLGQNNEVLFTRHSYLHRILNSLDLSSEKQVRREESRWEDKRLIDRGAVNS